MEERKSLHDRALELYNAGDCAGAAALLENSGNADCVLLRSICLAALGRITEAINGFNLVAAAAPDNLTVIYNRALAYENAGNADAAERDYRRSLELMPGHRGASNNVARIMVRRHDFGAAEVVCRQALALHPQHIELLGALAGVLTKTLRCREAAQVYAEIVRLSPSALTFRSNMLMNLNYLEDTVPGDLFRMHREWDREARKLNSVAEEPGFSGADRIRVGYFSPDLRTHSVAYFFEPLLRAHDRKRVEIHCFSDVLHPDSVTDRMRETCECWHDVSRMSTPQLHQLMRDCRLDVAVDLAGHTSRRLPVFSRRVAPLQFTYLGYPNTTGIKNMDYRVTDDLADPPGSERMHSEKLLRLPGGMWAYAPSADAPPCAPPPVKKNGFFSFASFNNLAKLSDATISAWSEILRRAPEAKLLLKDKSLKVDSVRDTLLRRFAVHGIEASRLILKSHAPSQREHYSCYNEADLALDPFPYNGTTTTFEALWMGVPVMTLKGDNHAARVGAAIMGRLGLNSFVTDSLERYIAISAAHAAAPEALEPLRKVMRGLLAASPLLDGHRLARELEDIYGQCVAEKRG